MSEQFKKFSVILPAELTKGEDGAWNLQGLASTSALDQQNEIIMMDGVDMTPVDQGRGILNWDHLAGPENIVGTLDAYKKTPKGLFIKGKLFKNHDKAKAIQQIMTSLGKSDRGRVGLSVQGRILERGGEDGKVIKKCRIDACAITMNPVNTDTYADLVKSMSSQETEVEFTPKEETYSKEQVLELIEKALGVGAGAATEVPSQRTGGDALAMESLDKKPKNVQEYPVAKKTKMKKMKKALYKSAMAQVMDKIQLLYPDVPRDFLWKALKKRLTKKFPNETTPLSGIGHNDG